MSSDDGLPADKRTPYERFRDLAKRVPEVPPEELKRRQAEYEGQHDVSGAKKRGPQKNKPNS